MSFGYWCHDFHHVPVHMMIELDWSSWPANDQSDCTSALLVIIQLGRWSSILRVGPRQCSGQCFCLLRNLFCFAQAQHDRPRRWHCLLRLKICCGGHRIRKPTWVKKKTSMCAVAGNWFDEKWTTVCVLVNSKQSLWKLPSERQQRRTLQFLMRSNATYV